MNELLATSFKQRYTRKKDSCCIAAGVSITWGFGFRRTPIGYVLLSGVVRRIVLLIVVMILYQYQLFSRHFHILGCPWKC